MNVHKVGAPTARTLAGLRSTQGWLARLGVVLAVAVLFGCASDVVVEQVDLSADPDHALNALRSGLDEARGKNVHLFSPTWYRRATESYEAARGLRQSGGENKAVLEVVARAKAEMLEAQRYAAFGNEKLGSVFEARQAAANAGAAKLYSKEYEDLNERFLDLGRTVEDGDFDDAVKDAKSVERAFRDLELRAIKETMLGEAGRLLDKAEDLGARKFVPISLAAARKELVDADAFITQNRYSSQVQARAEGALRQAQHVNIVMQQVRDWSKMTEEQKILTVEQRIIPVDRLVSGEESSLRVRPLGEYFTSVHEGVKSMQDAQRFLNDEVQNLHGELTAARAELAKLGKVKERHEQEQAFAAKFTRVRNLFEPREADVYRQGDDVLIRLKGLNFEVGNYYIVPEHYPLLAKLQKAIRAFDARAVWVEGHTDTTGSALTNQTLSQRRAEAVSAYLVNNGTVARENISALGYGPDKPIAANTTAEGRKLNRRIDVILVAH